MNLDNGPIYLENGSFSGSGGRGSDLGLTFRTEKDLDEHLWMDPSAAVDDISFLLKVNKGEMSPLLSRLALKALTLPMFEQAHHGDDLTPELQENLHSIPKRTSVLLGKYLDRIEDPNDVVLNQAIDETMILMLVLDEQVMLLPTSPVENHPAQPTKFSVLRPKELGRTSLYIANIPPLAAIKGALKGSGAFRIAQKNLLTEKATRFDLAEALIAEQNNEALTASESKLIESARTHVHSEIAKHFTS